MNLISICYYFGVCGRDEKDCLRQQVMPGIESLFTHNLKETVKNVLPEKLMIRHDFL